MRLIVRLLRTLIGVGMITVVFLMDKLRKSSKLEKHLLKVGVVKRFKAMYDRPGPWQKGAAEHDHDAGDVDEEAEASLAGQYCPDQRASDTDEPDKSREIQCLVLLPAVAV